MSELNPAETYLILKYGTIADAYRAWSEMTYKEEAVFTPEQRQVLRDFEYGITTRTSWVR